MFKFRAENKDKINKSKALWNNKNAEKIKSQNAARCRKWREINIDKARTKSGDWAKANPEKVRDMKKRWLDKNRSKHNLSVASWCMKNRPARRLHWHNYKSRKLAAGGTFTKLDVIELQKSQKDKCVYCGKDISSSYHIDHIMPLALGGSNGKENIQLLCPHCNLVKGAKHPTDFMMAIGL